MKYKLINKLNFEEFKKSYNYIKNIRISVKGIIKNKLEEILVISLKSEEKRVLKLPGGGVKLNEPYDVALKREIQEETGLLISNISQFGCSLNFVKEWEMAILTIFMKADLDNNKKVCQNLTQLEKKQKLIFKWLNIQDAICEMKKNKHNFYSELINNRDLNILLEYLEYNNYAKSKI